MTPVSIPDPNAVAEAILDRLDPRLARLERAILGDDTIGHVGLVSRVRDLEEVAKSEEITHQAIDERRRASVARAHERIEEVEQQIKTELQSLENRVNRMLWVAAGIGIGSGLGAGWLAQLLGP